VTDRHTDRQTDGRTGVSKERAIAYMLSRAKNLEKDPNMALLQWSALVQWIYSFLVILVVFVFYLVCCRFHREDFVESTDGSFAE